MDPLTAFGLSASVVQFVSFASDLISKSKEIHSSAKGCSAKVLTLETVYTQLRDLSTSLESSSQKDPRLAAVEGTSVLAKHVFAINDLSRSCKIDCDRLLEVLRKLQGGNRSRNRWQSFGLALKTVWKSSEIADLEFRLHHTQTTLTLHIDALTSYWHGIFHRQLREMRCENESLNSLQSARLGDIAQLIHDLGTRIPDSDRKTPAKSVQPADIESLQSQISQLSVAKADVAKEQTILRSLSFESRPIRYSSILEAHHQTFKWVLQEPCNQHERSTTGDLLGWLQKGDGLFWVSGKPGSGKSTLMKFVTDHPKTIQALSAWSYPKTAVIVRHFFWSAGTPMQKSWQGLLQTLMYEIFRQLPNLIESTCSERWPKTIEQLNHEAWHLPELRRILQRIADQENLSAKFCFFIDGLDEVEGDHLEICGILQSLSRSPNVKLCVSSRPWNVFEDQFGRDVSSKLYMHRLTETDIRSYVGDMLRQHPRWKELNIEIANAEWLIDQITERAAGVFLWVFLVTRQLRNGLTEYDSFSDLRRRLENVPTDLEMFFKQILDSVEPFYHEKMATTLQIALEALQPAPALIYAFHDEEYEDQDYALKLSLRPLDPEQVESMLKQIARRLNGRTRGLLDVNENCVEFLHRTVMDYLRTPEMTHYLDKKAPARSNANLSLLRAFTAYMKCTKFSEFVDRTDFGQYTASSLMISLQEALAHASSLEGSITTCKLLDELACCIPRMHETGQASLNVWGNAHNPVRLFFWEPVVNASLVEYLRDVLPRLPDYFPEFIAPAESCMIFYMIISLTTSLEPRKQMDLLRRLLRASCHPTSTYCDVDSSDITEQAVHLAWKVMLRNVMPSNLTLAEPGSLSSKILDTATWKLDWVLRSGLFALMLEHGANPNASIDEQPTLDSTPIWMNFVLLSFCMPPESSYQELYFRDLDHFIIAGADMGIAMPGPRVGDSQSQNMTGLNLFLDHLSRISASNYDRISFDVLLGVLERLLSMTKATGANIDDYWPLVENVFPPQIVSNLKGKFSGTELEMGWSSPDMNVQMQKQAPAHALGDAPSFETLNSGLPRTDESYSFTADGIP